MEEVVRIGQLELRFLAIAADTKGGLTLFEVKVPSNARVPVAHYHVEVDEAVYGLDGILTFSVDGKKHLVGKGDHVVVPCGAVHRFINVNEGDACFLSVLTPGLIGPAFFRDAADVVNTGGPPDLKKMGEVMRRHGLVPVPPATA